MDTEKKRQQLWEAEGSLARCERLMYRQRRIVMELERQGQEAVATSARSLLRAYEKSYETQLARRDWLRREFARFTDKERG
jgi:hypothetical protein